MRCAWCGEPATGIAMEIGDTQTNPSCGALLHGIHFRPEDS